MFFRALSVLLFKKDPHDEHVLEPWATTPRGLDASPHAIQDRLYRVSSLPFGLLITRRYVVARVDASLLEWASAEVTLHWTFASKRRWLQTPNC